MLSRLSAERIKQNLSIDELATLSDIGPGTIRRIESPNNPYRVNIEVAKALAGALGVSIYELFDKQDLSPLGRPPHTGKPLAIEQTLYPREVLCRTCNQYFPIHADCDNCDAEEPMRQTG